MHAAIIYDAGVDDKLMFFFHGPKMKMSLVLIHYYHLNKAFGVCCQINHALYIFYIYHISIISYYSIYIFFIADR